LSSKLLRPSHREKGKKLHPDRSRKSLLILPFFLVPSFFLLLLLVLLLAAALVPVEVAESPASSLTRTTSFALSKSKKRQGGIRIQVKINQVKKKVKLNADSELGRISSSIKKVAEYIFINT
jgi:hypothetical protein